MVDAVGYCKNAAESLIRYIPREKGLVVNDNNEAFGIVTSDFYAIARELFGFVYRFRGKLVDYNNLIYVNWVLEGLKDRPDFYHQSSKECSRENDAFDRALWRYYDTAVFLMSLPKENIIMDTSDGRNITFVRSDIVDVASGLLGIVVAYRGNKGDYRELASSLESRTVPEGQRMDNLNRIIQNYSQASILNPENSDICYRLGRSRNRLGDLLEGRNDKMRVDAYLGAIEASEEGIMLKEDDRLHSSVGYSYFMIGCLRRDRDERIRSFRKAIEHMRMACNLNGNSTNYYYLAASEEFLAEHFHEPEEREIFRAMDGDVDSCFDEGQVLMRDAIRHYRVALSIEDNPKIKKRLDELEHSIES